MKVLENIINLLLKNNSKEYISKEEICESIAEGYEDYCNRPQEYKDNVLRSMFKDTKYAKETPEKLREIIRKQIG